MDQINLLAGWIRILCGMVSGAIHGLYFHRLEWLGGYMSWPRRLVRLGHISFFGLGFINLAFALSLPAAHAGSGITLSGWALIIGALTMPCCCYFVAFAPAGRHVFVVPVVSLITGVSVFVTQGLMS